MSENRVMLITGTSRGIGRYLAEYYVKKRVQVIGCSRRPVANELKNYQHFCLDVSDEPKVKQMFSEIRKTHNRLDVLINNAGAHAVNHSLLTPLKTVQDVFNTNMIATFLFCREASKLMRKNSYGRIVNISTIAVPLCSVGTSIYSASKAAMEQFSKVLAREVGSDGITVNTLGLSIVDHSGMVENLSEEAISEALGHTVFKLRLGFGDITHAIDFLISEKSKAVTKQTLYLGGP